MKSFIWLLIRHFVVITAVVANYHSFIGDGAVNLALFLVWCEILLICLGGLALFDENKMESFIGGMNKHRKPSWIKKVNRTLMLITGLVLIYCGYLVTGVAWFLALVFIRVIDVIIQDHLKKGES